MAPNSHDSWCCQLSVGLFSTVERWMSFQQDSQPESLDTAPKQTPPQACCFQHDGAFTAIAASGFSSEFRAFSTFYSFRQNVQFGYSTALIVQQNENKTISRVQSLWFMMKCQPVALDLWQVTGIHTITIIMRKSNFKETILKGAETHFFVYPYPILKANTFSSF